MSSRACRRILVLGLLAGPGASCTSYSSFRFAPPIQEVELRDEVAEARMVVSWRGIGELDDTHELRFRIRFESLASTTFHLEPADFELLDAALTPFDYPRSAVLPLSVEPGTEATFDVAFPVVEGRELRDHDLSALNLRVRFADGRWSSNTTFERVEHPYHDPYYDPWYVPWHFSVGVVWGG